MKRANTMSTITVELTIKVKNKFTSSNAEKIQWIHLTTDVKFSHPQETALHVVKQALPALELRMKNHGVHRLQTHPRRTSRGQLRS